MAAIDATYVTIGPSGDLTNERRLAVGVSLTMVDSGPNAAVTINTIQDIRTTAIPEFAGATVVGNMRVNGFFIQNETTGLWHELRLDNNPDGDPEFFPDDTGVA